MWKKIEDELESLHNLQPDLTNKPNDFNAFWQAKKHKVLQHEPKVTINWIDFPVPTVDVGEIELISWDNTPLKGIIVKPKGITKSSILCSFHGLTGHKGYPTEFLKWMSLGLTVISFDVRGQGESADYARYSNGSRVQGWVLKGILDPHEHYYTNIYQDIMVQLQWIAKQSIVDPVKIGVIGSSQGGAIATAATGLMPELVDFSLIDCPFMTYVEPAISEAQMGSYTVIKDYFKLNDPQLKHLSSIRKTLSYVDTVYFAEEITCPVLMATGLMDPVAPPISAFALFNSLATKDKQIDAYARYEHEVVPEHELKKFRFIHAQCFKKK